MSEDKQLDFYLKHRAQIEEWAALRERAQQVVDDALHGAVDALGQDLGELVEVSYQGTRIVKLRIPGHETEPTWIELQWQRSSLMTNWPNLILVATPDKEFQQVKGQLIGACRSVALALGMRRTSGAWWMFSRQLEPEADPLDPEEYAHYCVTETRAAWDELKVPMARVLSAKATSNDADRHAF